MFSRVGARSECAPALGLVRGPSCLGPASSTTFRVRPRTVWTQLDEVQRLRVEHPGVHRGRALGENSASSGSTTRIGCAPSSARARGKVGKGPVRSSRYSSPPHHAAQVSSTSCPARSPTARDGPRDSFATCTAPAAAARRRSRKEATRSPRARPEHAGPPEPRSFRRRCYPGGARGRRDRQRQRLRLPASVLGPLVLERQRVLPGPVQLQILRGVEVLDPVSPWGSPGYTICGEVPGSTTAPASPPAQIRRVREGPGGARCCGSGAGRAPSRYAIRHREREPTRS